MDIINGAFESVAGVLIWMNVITLYKDKTITGVHWCPVLVFTLWGFWNLVYYPHLGQWISFFGGIAVVTANTTWLIQMVYYKNRASTDGDLVA